MRYFFVDTENVQAYNFLKELDVNEKDELVLIVSKNSQRIKMDDLKLMTDSKANIVYKEIEQCSKNAMDFCLIVELTMKICKDKSNQYLVVSNDGDFAAPVNHLKKICGAKVDVIKPKGNRATKKNVNKKVDVVTAQKKNTPKHPVSNELDDKVFDIMFESNDMNEIHAKLGATYGSLGPEIYKKYKKAFEIMFESSKLDEFHNGLKTQYGDEGLEIYKKCKNRFRMKKKTQDKVLDIMLESNDMNEIYAKLGATYGSLGQEIYKKYKKAFEIMFESSKLDEFHNGLKIQYGNEGLGIYKKCKDRFRAKKKIGGFK